MYLDGYCINYEYDLYDRLVKVVGRNSGITTYEYDANGNAAYSDRSNGTVPCAYDTDGNIITNKVADSENWQYIRTVKSHLEAVANDEKNSWLSIYDGDNKRVFHISNAFAESEFIEGACSRAHGRRNGNSYTWENGNRNGGNGTIRSNNVYDSTNNLEQKYNYS